MTLKPGFWSARLILVGAMLAVLFGVGAGFGIRSADTVRPAAACNPCDCENDNRDNCQGVEFYATYVRTTPTGFCYIDVYRIDSATTGRPVLRVSQDTLARFPANPAANFLIRQNQGIALYRLATGELQLNAGPDANGKVFTLLFDGCPYTRIDESTYQTGS